VVYAFKSRGEVLVVHADAPEYALDILVNAKLIGRVEEAELIAVGAVVRVGMTGVAVLDPEYPEPLAPPPVSGARKPPKRRKRQ